MPHPFHPYWLTHHNIWCGVQVLKLLISQFSSVSCYFLIGQNTVPSIVFSNSLIQPEIMCHYIHKTRGHIALQLHSEDQWCQSRLKVSLSLCLNITYEGIWNSKGNVIPGLNSLSIMPWGHMGDWRYSSTILNLGTRWRWVVSFMLL
jgi:hypothetical protein